MDDAARAIPSSFVAMPTLWNPVQRYLCAGSQRNARLLNERVNKDVAHDSFNICPNFRMCGLWTLSLLSVRS